MGRRRSHLPAHFYAVSGRVSAWWRRGPYTDTLRLTTRERPAQAAPASFGGLERSDRPFAEERRSRDERCDHQANQDQALCLHRHSFRGSNDSIRPGAWRDASLLKS